MCRGYVQISLTCTPWRLLKVDKLSARTGTGGPELKIGKRMGAPAGFRVRLLTFPFSLSHSIHRTYSWLDKLYILW